MNKGSLSWYRYFSPWMLVYTSSKLCNQSILIPAHWGQWASSTIRITLSRVAMHMHPLRRNLSFPIENDAVLLVEFFTMREDWFRRRDDMLESLRVVWALGSRLTRQPRLVDRIRPRRSTWRREIFRICPLLQNYEDEFLVKETEIESETSCAKFFQPFFPNFCSFFALKRTGEPLTPPLHHSKMNGDISNGGVAGDHERVAILDAGAQYGKVLIFIVVLFMVAGM